MAAKPVNYLTVADDHYKHCIVKPMQHLAVQRVAQPHADCSALYLVFTPAHCHLHASGCALFHSDRLGHTFDVTVDGHPALNLTSSDFLGLGNDPVVQVWGLSWQVQLLLVWVLAACSQASCSRHICSSS